LATDTHSTPPSRRALWLKLAALFVLLGVGIALVPFGPFLQARFELARNGIGSAEIPEVLHQACARDDLETLARLRTARVGLDHLDEQGATPLHTAVGAGAAGAVGFLLAAGADQQRLNAEDQPPLSLALGRDGLAIARRLLAAGGDPLVPLGEARRPAPFAAVERGNPALLRLLLDFAVDPNLTDPQGHTLLAHAVGHRDHESTRLLLGHGASPDARLASGLTALGHAAGTGDLGLAEMLLDHGADPNALDVAGTPALAHAVAGHQAPLARLLLARGARLPPPPPGEPSLLHRAAEQGDLATLRLLIKHGGDIEAPFPNGRRLVEYAVYTGNRELLCLLLGHGAEAGDLLARALREGDAAMVLDLLAEGVPVDARIDDQPLIEWAVRHAAPRLVGLLLDYGADPDGVGREGQSLLALAVALDRPEIVATLADHGADIDARVSAPASDAFTALFPTRYARFYLTKDRGLTPLMLAVLRGRQDTVRVLLARKARLDTPTGEHGTWPIGLAAWQEDVAMMQLLLGRDPDPGKQPRRILVSLADQTATLYVDGKATLETRVSTGRSGYETPPGKYVITNKHRRWTSTIYDAKMPYFLRLNAGAIGLHEGAVPNHPASHGCIRVPAGTARRLFAATRVGDPVTIVEGSPAAAEAAYFDSDEQAGLN
jgi:ankyrin repeat protein